MIGAAFRGAGLSRQFKVKEIKVKDITPYPVEVDYSSEPKESDDGNILSDLLLKFFN
jgi:hypoxia up-regulated 1